MYHRIFLHLLSIPLLLSVSGCSTMYDWLRADPAPQTSFLDGNFRMVEQSPDFPFRKMWIDKDTDLRKYKRIIVAPVTTGHLMDSAAWDKFDERSVAGELKDDSKDIAKYMELSFYNAISYDPRKRFMLVDKAGPGTLRLEIALVQLQPSKAELNYAENIIGIIVWPVSFLTIFNSGTTAFEGILRDSQTGKVVCAIADREKDEAAIFNIPGFTYYGNARYFTDRWSRQFVDFMNAKDYTKLKTDFPFKLIVF
ncbi:MAG TPA: hypothetical protein DET40_00565 [Lentisphaeria bacterium]|nr:MAG: hypothetical protein A2X45_05190 [Lentisphaerae bacterium GWF2_50_93]HCE42025.1 hypothetical protein [Lentisphaeria bacterium]